MKLILNMFFCLIIKIYTDLNIINKRTSLPHCGVKLSCVCLMFAYVALLSILYYRHNMTQMTTDTCRMKSEAEDPIGHLRNEYKLEDRGLFPPTRPQMVAKN